MKTFPMNMSILTAFSNTENILLFFSFACMSIVLWNKEMTKSYWQVNFSACIKISSLVPDVMDKISRTTTDYEQTCFG